MKLDIIQILKDSFSFTWRKKVLWIFGFLVAITGGSGGSGINSNGGGSSRSSTSDQSNFSATEMDKFRSEAAAVVNSPIFWTIVVVVSILIALFAFVFWYVGNRAKIALINAVKYDNEGRESEIGFRSLWSESGKSIWRVLKISLLEFFLALLVVVPFIAIVFGLIATTGLGIGDGTVPLVFVLLGALLLFLVLIIALIIFGCVLFVAEILTVYYGTGVRDSIKIAYALIKSNFKDFFIGWLLMLGVGILVGILSLIVILPLALLLFTPGIILLFSVNSPIGGILLVIGFIIFIVVVFVIASPLVVQSTTFWTKLTVAIKERSQNLN